MREIKWIFLFLFISAFSYAQIDTKKDTIQAEMQKNSASSSVAVISISELEGEEESGDISGLLQSSRDIFVSTAGYTFGAARFRIRGYDSENSTVMMNGVSLNDMESGRVYWGSWGGLNDALRNSEILNGISNSQFTFGGIGGASNMEVRASSYAPTTKFTFSHLNKSYNQRVMLTYATGLMENGWAFTFSGSKRWAQEGYIEGTSYDAYAYFLSIEKKINDKHSIGFVGYGAPSKRGKSSAVVNEIYELTDNNYYNPYWGYQNGEVRNSRISNYHKPMMILSHYWDFDEDTKLTTSASYMFGRGGGTALNWYNGNDPRPDYYRNVPSYWEDNNDIQFEKLQNLWLNGDENTTQINWDRMYHWNYNAWYNAENVNGEEGNTIYGRRSNFIIEDRRNDSKKMNLTSTFNSILNENTKITAGIDLTRYQGDRYTVVDDLLGGDFYVDINKFIDRDNPDPDAAQSDLNNPNRIVKEGDIFGYHYTSNINKYMAWAQASFEYNKVDFFTAVNVSYDEFWRTGHMKTGIYPQDSYGDSDITSFINYGVKGGATYKLSGRQFLSANLMYQTRSPQIRDAFLSARTRNQMVDDITNEKIASVDANYLVRYPKFNARLSGYYSSFNDKIKTRSYYDEGLSEFVNYSMTGIDIVNRGFEFGAQYEVITNLKISTVAAIGESYYNSRPTSTSTADNIGEVLRTQTLYVKNYYVGGTPQTALNLGLDYRTSFFMYFGADLNFFDRAYLPMQLERRTQRAVAGVDPDHPDFDLIIQQEKLPSGFTLDLNVGKSWRIDYKYYINLNLSVSNVLNNEGLVTWGYEQFRFAGNDIDKFANKYSYMYGRTYYLNVSFRF